MQANPENMEVIKRHTDRLFDNLYMIQNKYARDNADIITHEQMCETLVTTAANLLRFNIYTCIKPDLHEFAVNELAKNMLDILKKSIEEEKKHEEELRKKFDSESVDTDGIIC